MASKLTITQKRWLLSAHILFSVAWLGTAVCSLVLSILAATTRDGNEVLYAVWSTDSCRGQVLQIVRSRTVLMKR